MQTRWFGLAAALIAAYGAGLYYEQTFARAGCCALTWPTPDPIQAERILGQADPKGVNAAAEKQAATASIGARPGDPTGWLRLSYADWLAHNGNMTDVGKRALDTSYLLTPYGGSFTPWRIFLGLNNWSALPKATRQDVVNELQISVGDSRVLPAVKAIAQGVGDPSGRMVAALLGIAPIATPGKPAS